VTAIVNAPLTGRFSHLFLLARDFATMVAFYRDTLGWTLQAHAEGEFAFFDMGSPGARLAIYPGRQTGSAIENHWFIVIDVENITAAVSQLAARGVDVGEIMDVPHGRAATFSDPEGNVIELHQPG
jgi:predicted enzyme related to lactoylglutathione lyase